jgi:hypothetical protein
VLLVCSHEAPAGLSYSTMDERPLTHIGPTKTCFGASENSENKSERSNNARRSVGLMSRFEFLKKFCSIDYMAVLLDRQEIWQNRILKDINKRNIVM